MSSSNSARRSEPLASGAELFLYRTEGKYFFQRIAIIMILGVLLVSFSAGHAVGEGRSALQRSLPDLLVAGVWSRQRRTCRDDLARKKPAVLRQKHLWSLTSPLLSTSSLKRGMGHRSLLSAS